MRLTGLCVALVLFWLTSSCDTRDKGAGDICFVNATLTSNLSVTKSVQNGENENLLIAAPDAFVEQTQSAFLTLKSGQVIQLEVADDWTSDTQIIVDLAQQKTLFKDVSADSSENNDSGEVALAMQENAELTAAQNTPAYTLDKKVLAEAFNSQRPNLTGVPNHVDTKICGAREISMILFDQRDKMQIKIDYKVVAGMWLSAKDFKAYEDLAKQ